MKQTEDKQPGLCGQCCLGSAALGFMSVRIWRKSCSPETKCGEWMGERCKGMCGALRVWMIGEINQVPSEPSCQSHTFPSAPSQRNYVSAYFIYLVFFFFFKETGPEIRCFFWAFPVSLRLPVAVFLSCCSYVRAHVWMVMNNQALLGYLNFL